MLETPHVVVGAAIAIKVGNPALALPLALASHFVLDKVPHWNPHLYTETQKLGKPSRNSTIVGVVDIALSLVSGLWIASIYLPDYQKVGVILAGSLLAVLPDVVKYPYYYLKVRNRYLVRWVKFERALQVNASPLPGVLTQLAIIIAAFWWMLS